MQTYDFNCSLPAAGNSLEVHFVKNPDVRGSLQIVWICLTTLFVCVYQVLKLNLPDPRDQHAHPTTIRVLKTIGLAFLVLLAPEVVLTESIFELKDARKKRKSLNEAAHDSGHSWSLIQTFYANMGGIVVKQENGNLAPVDGATLAKLIERGYIIARPPLTDTEIMDKSKDDVFSKTIAIGQILYFSIDFLARIIQSTPTSQLELGVASTALYSVISYILGWWKPKSIETPTVIELRQTSHGDANGSQLGADESSDVATLLDGVPGRRLRSSGPHVRDVVTKGSLPPMDGKLGSYLRVLRHSEADDESLPMVMCCLLVSIPPGAIHVAGWNFPFPSVADTWLWRSSSIAATAAGPAIIGLLIVAVLLDDVSEAISSFSAIVFTLTLTLTYVVARVILVVLMIRLLFYLPPQAFHATSWSMSIPHIG